MVCGGGFGRGGGGRLVVPSRGVVTGDGSGGG